ncbi:MAG: hypothetical protein IAE77_01565 [Prosthecobacter sp.]|uniref:agenet domain-containing protein n=1 Tax=Prosthecobacter sp. TaxID=1965333 RepID=UPI0019F85912|nr:hypothetical protein [Prosthecobacter sp.]
MQVSWFIDKIANEFNGSEAMLFSDCCYSGGMVELARACTDTRVSFGALSTTGCCNLGYSGWRFLDVLARAWAGDVAMDFDETGTISFIELCFFAERYMAFVAEGKPLYASTKSFNEDLILAKTDRPAKDGIGMFVEAREGKSWYKAEVIDAKENGSNDPEEFLVHFTDKSRYAKQAWVAVDDIREYDFQEYEVGTRVEIRNADGQWLPGKVIDTFEHMHECSYDGKSAAYNEWMSPSRIRPQQ